MKVDPKSALISLELFLYTTLGNLQRTDCSEEHRMKFYALLSAILPKRVFEEHTEYVLQAVKRGLQAPDVTVREQTLQLLNHMLETRFTLDDIDDMFT